MNRCKSSSSYSYSEAARGTLALQLPEAWRASVPASRSCIGWVVVLLFSLSASTLFAAPIIEPPPTNAPAWVAGYRMRWPVHVAVISTQFTAQSVITAIPTGGWLKPDGSDVAVQAGDGRALPVRVVSHDPTGDTILQFPVDIGTNVTMSFMTNVVTNAVTNLTSNVTTNITPPATTNLVTIVTTNVTPTVATNLTSIATTNVAMNAWYWIYGVNAAAPPASGPVIPEGLTVEVREWAGERLDAWAQAVDGLKKSETVMGNCVVGEIAQGSNPFRPDLSTRFAASYRGYLYIPTNGVYRFLPNADDAAFLFIDDFKVFERPGANIAFSGKMPVGTGGGTIELTNGVHKVEVHHIMGNNPQGGGRCSLIWVRAGETKWELVPRTNYVHAAYALAGPPEEAAAASACSFHWGIDDAVLTTGLNMFLVRFEAIGKVGAPDALLWDMGDGVTRKGKSVTHLYLKPGEYKVALKSLDGLPLFTQKIYVWPVSTGITNPLFLTRALESIRQTEWQKYPLPMIFQVYDFLETCDLPDRWTLLEAVGRHLLAQPGLDPAVKVRVTSGLMLALAEQGRGQESLQMGDAALKEFAKLAAFEVTLRLKLGDVQYRYLKNVQAASEQYRTIVEKFAKLDAVEVRLAAIRLGDIAAELGDNGGAAEAYRLASRLGGRQFETSDTSDAIKRGATLRIVEQQLRAGNPGACRALLQKIERETPEQKLQAMYSFLHAEVDRVSGRYDEALRHYEIVLRQVQWSGMHDRVLFGISDVYRRMGNLPKAREVLAKLKEAFPKYYEEKLLAEYQKTIDEVPPTPAAAAGTPPPPPGADLSVPFVTGFEPGEKEPAGENTSAFPIVVSQGMVGPMTTLMSNWPVYRGHCDWRLPVAKYIPGAPYWCEAWYRDAFESNRGFNDSHTWFYLNDAKAQSGPRGAERVNNDASYGKWRKSGAVVRAPMSLDGALWFAFRFSATHLTEIDAISLTPIAERQVDELAQFIASREEQLP